MNIEELRNFALSLPCTTEGFPFDEVTLAFKVCDKLFLLTSTDRQPLSVNLKCEPELAVELREQYSSVVPGYHMNKRLWNTIELNGELSDEEIKYWIRHSYTEVVKKLSKKLKEELAKNQQITITLKRDK